MALQRKPIVELINVHRVTGDKQAIIFLKNSEKEFVEGLFYQAKHYGQATFFYDGVKFDILRNKDFSFSIFESPEQDITTEQFA